MELTKEALSGINQIINGYENNTIEIVDGLDYNQYQTLKKIEYYWNSKYLNGQKDSIGRIKPFYNISKFRVNVATRATDLDIKDVKVSSDNPSDRVRSLIFNKELYTWMKESNFAKTLNEAGQTRPKYGGVLIKKCIEKIKGKDELKIEVVEWKNVITDPVDVIDGVIVEKHYMSPAELSKKQGIWENVEDAIKLATKDKEGSEGTEFRVPVYEVHGEFPETYDPRIEDGNKNVYKNMVFFIAGGENKQVVLWYDEEKESPYKYLPWDKVSGRGLGVGIVEDGFEAQMWTNDAIIAEKNVMDIAGKVFVKTTSEKFGNNIITEAETGQVFVLEDGTVADIMNLTPNSLPQFQNLVEKWNTQYERATNTFETVSGETLPSNTPLGSVAIQSAQASSFFDYRREEAGIFWREVFNDWIIPFLIKRINKAHILASDYSAEELDMIDNAFAQDSVSNKIIEDAINGKIHYAEEKAEMMEAYKLIQRENKERRYLDIPENYFKDFMAKITIDLTGEAKNKQENLTSLFNILTQIAANPMLLQDPNLMQIFSQMLEISGIKFYPQAPTQAIQNTGTKMEQQSEPALTRQTEAVLPEAQQ
jgi:hypothetical protein